MSMEEIVELQHVIDGSWDATDKMKALMERAGKPVEPPDGFCQDMPKEVRVKGWTTGVALWILEKHCPGRK